MSSLVLAQCFAYFGLLALCFSLRPSFALWLYAAANALFFTFRPFVDPHIRPGGIDRLESSAGQALAMILIIPLFFLRLPKKHLRLAKDIFITLGAVDAALLLNPGYGFLWATTFDAAFLAMLMPLCPWPLALCFLFSILKAKSFTALTIIAAQMTIIHWGKFKKLALSLMWILLAGILYIKFGHDFRYGIERIQKWQEFYAWWHMADRMWFGTGAGSYFWLSPHVGNYLAPNYLQAHNDFVQCLFEFGRVGLALMLVTFGWLFLKTDRQGKILLAGVGACMLSYYPLHHFVTAALVGLIVRIAIEGERHEGRTKGIYTD